MNDTTAVGEEQIVLTVDVGGSGVKVAAYDVAAHRSLGRVTMAYDPGSWNSRGTECDVESWWATTLAAIAALVDRLARAPGAFVAITVGAIRIPFVLLDGRGRIVRPCIANRDRRAESEAAELDKMFDPLELYRRTGHWPAPEFGLAKLLWLKRHEPETFGQTRQLLQLHDWLIYMLCGAIASEASSAAMSQLLEASGGGWATDLLAEVGIPEGWLPDIRTAGTHIGSLYRDVAASVGLRAGMAVHVGGGDTQLSALGAGALADDGHLVVVAGTTAPVQVARPTPVTAADTFFFPLLVSRQLIGGWSAYEANAGAVGSVMSTLDGVSPLRGDDLGRALHERGFAIGEPASEQVVAVPVGNPSFGPRSWAAPPPHRIVGLDADSDGADVVRSAREGGCFAVQEVIACVRSHAPGAVGPVTATGGLTDSPMWPQTLADVLGETVTVPDSTLTAGLGGASVVAGRSLWSVEDTTQSTRYEPDGAAASYRQRRHAYLRLYARSSPGQSSLAECNADAR